MWPQPPNQRTPLAAQSPDPVEAPEEQTVNSEQQESIREARENVRRETAAANDNGPDADVPTGPVIPPPKQDYREGIPIPGKPGFVFNPFTNRPVDVRAIPPGTLVRDPEDPNPDHKFRVP